MNDFFNNYPINDYRYYLQHHGIKGQQWGVRNALWYPIADYLNHLKNTNHKDKTSYDLQAEKRYVSNAKNKLISSDKERDEWEADVQRLSDEMLQYKIVGGKKAYSRFVADLAQKSKEFKAQGNNKDYKEAVKKLDSVLNFLAKEETRLNAQHIQQNIFDQQIQQIQQTQQNIFDQQIQQNISNQQMQKLNNQAINNGLMTMSLAATGGTNPFLFGMV